MRVWSYRCILLFIDLLLHAPSTYCRVPGPVRRIIKVPHYILLFRQASLTEKPDEVSTPIVRLRSNGDGSAKHPGQCPHVLDSAL